MAIVSNGTGQFPMAWMAAGLAKRGALARLITAGYPTQRVIKAVDGRLTDSASLRRLLARAVDLNESCITPVWSAEVAYQTAAVLRSRRASAAVAPAIDALSMRLYAAAASRALRRSHGARIYHYRSGFGLGSVRLAKRLGMIALCQHTIAHPEVLRVLIDDNGRRPDPGERIPLDPALRQVLWDVEQADFVLAESDFEVETFAWRGFDRGRIRAIYPGPGPDFMAVVPPHRPPPRLDQPASLLFVGDFGPRKGAPILAEALGRLDRDWRLTIRGAISPETRARLAGFLDDPRVREVGFVSIEELARLMTEADYFVFPTLAEGSARVGFEALASGCYVVTTPNSGTVARHGENGRLVPAGDAEALANALRLAIDERARLPEIAERNGKLIRERYTPEAFIDQVLDLYDDLLSGRISPRSLESSAACKPHDSGAMAMAHGGAHVLPQEGLRRTPLSPDRGEPARWQSSPAAGRLFGQSR